MQNDVPDAKLTPVPECTIEDVQYWSDFTTMYAVDNEGEPMEVVDDTSGDFKCYYCEGCGEEFNSFEEVKEHLK